MSAHTLTPGDERAVDYIMEAVQCFASEWSLVGGRFDRGEMLEQAEGTKARIRRMLEDQTRPSVALTDSDILLLTCQHTGQRINLRIDECQQHIDFARAAIAKATGAKP